MFNDLREFIDQCRKLGELKQYDGVDWDLELGVLTEIEAQQPDAPLVLFDNIKGYPPGYRVAANLFAWQKRMAWLFGFPPSETTSEAAVIQNWRDRTRQELKPLAPVEVNTGPVLENVHLGDDINLWEFPVPKWHELDGGRYIGTGDMVINRDPETGWVNFGTYRVQVHDRSTVTVYMSPGRHGELIARKYWDKGQSCPIAISCGQSPEVWAAATQQLPQGVSEYGWAGWLRGEPVEVVRGVATGIPVPATAEIVIEGDFLPPEKETLPEGPFGEWTGHYATARSGGRAPVVKVKSIMHRNNPVLLGAPPLLFAENAISTNITRAARLWDELDRQLPGVKGVSVIKAAGRHNMVVVSLEQKYPGHAKQAAMVVAGSHAGAYMLKYVIIVDPDIDPSNVNEVLWAIGSRTDPAISIDILRGCWGSQIDPFLTPQQRAIRDYTHSVAIIQACKPYHFINDFPPTIRTSPELLKKVKEKWGITN
ncbi:MAG: UbiD family decarboxylase [Chloroflexi bacterium]|nr:UbiD family decarboxylase [Chloroflexota bacterium]